jgi:hypothetical protein
MRDVYLAVADPEDEVIDGDGFGARLQRGARPDALLVDAAALLEYVPELSVLDGVLRIVMSTATLPHDVPSTFTDRLGLRLLRKPFELGTLEAALSWLRGESDDDSWAAEAPEPVDRAGVLPGQIAAQQ